MGGGSFGGQALLSRRSTGVQGALVCSKTSSFRSLRKQEAEEQHQAIRQKGFHYGELRRVDPGVLELHQRYCGFGGSTIEHQARNPRRFDQPKEAGRVFEVLHIELEGGAVFDEGLCVPNEGEPEGYLLHHWGEQGARDEQCLRGTSDQEGL